MRDSHNKSFPLNVKKALVLCSHTDDEWGCAGTVLRLVSAGAEIRYIAFSKCEESVPQGYPLDVLAQECKACTAALGLKPDNVEILDFPVRRFPEHRQDILQKLIDTKKAFSPDLVLGHSSSDTHQDHATLYAEAFRAFKHCTLLGYELPQNVITFENSAFVALTEEIVERKADALLRYKSQAHRVYATREFIKSLAKVRGVQCDVEYAEAFEVVRLMLR